MNAAQILKELEALGTEGYRNILRRHGVTGPLYGVKIQDLKKYEKVIKKDYQLALDLYATGVYDAMYLAGLIADEKQMTMQDLKLWLKTASCSAIAEYAVAWVAADGPHGWHLALEWIESEDEKTVVAGWGTLSGLAAVKPDASLDMGELRTLLLRVRDSIHFQTDKVKYKMNGFVISLGSHAADFTEESIMIGEEIGPLEIDMGDTSCKVPYAPGYIRKAVTSGKVGKKRKTNRC